MLATLSFDALATYALVAIAAVYVVWRVILPASLRARLSGRPASGCGTMASGRCGGGCPGCGAAGAPPRRPSQEPGTTSTRIG